MERNLYQQEQQKNYYKMKKQNHNQRKGRNIVLDKN